ncbi:MAG: hypothetical protein EXS08_16490 [Planctomycetes bacterium]|nr:hypothetical protein [Planctomycetota bacterium]
MSRLGTRVLGSVFVFVSVLAAPAAAQELRWRSGSVLARPAQRLAPAELERRLQQGGARHVLVRFERSPGSHQRDLLAAAGVELGRALGAGAFFARVEPRRLDARVVLRAAELLDVRELERAWKLHPTLAAGETPAWTIVRDGRAPSTDPLVALYVLLHAGESLERGDALLRALGGSTFDALESVNGLVALLPRSRVDELVAADVVAWVEPALPQLDSNALPANDSNRALIQVNALQTAPYNLSGSGVSVLVYDGGTARATHQDFGGRLSSRDGSGLIDHATHVSATIGGSGAASAGTFKGMAPGVTIESYGFQYDGTGTFLFTNPGDLESDYGAALALGADIANNSIGTNTESNGFDCAIQGVYGVTDALIDAVVRGSLGSPYRVVWANGNERGGTRCNVEGFGSYYSVAPPATAKNHITVGALNSNDDSMTTFSSWGPTDDGRLKPDISAPGCQAGGDGGVTSAAASSDTAYTVFCGTSMASPTVCGISALLLQDYRAQFGAPDPRNSTLKVLLAQTAFERGNAGPDYQFGYGSVRAQSAVDFMRLGQFTEESVLETGDTASFSVTVAPGAPELRLTLAWDDAAGTPSVLGSLVNDLDLVVRDPSNVQHHVWTLDPLNPSALAVQSAPNHLDNLEQVLVAAPTPGVWTIEVAGFDVPEGPQIFSLASSHVLTPEPHLSISFPSALPAVLAPGAATNVTARIVGVNDSVIGGSPTLHVRYDGGSFLALTMTPLGGDLYQGTLPPAVCSATPEYWFSAEGFASGTAASPSDAPVSTYQALVYSLTTVFDDTFQTDQGWTVANVSLATGAWQRATPNGGGARGDPATANGGSGLCYLTQNGAGDTDVDGGPTRLTSPLIDLSGASACEISYARWMVSFNGVTDAMTVEASNNDGASWTPVESVPGAPSGAWVAHSFALQDFVAPTNQVRVRFSVVDNPSDSVTEAGFDDFHVARVDCPALADCNHNGILDADDIASGRSLDADFNGFPDECNLPTGGKARANPNPPGSAPDRSAP